MAKRTYVAVSKICGIEPAKTDKAGNVVTEHTLEAGAEYSMDEAAAAPFIAGGSLVLKGAASAPDIDLDDEDDDAEKAKGK